MPEWIHSLTVDASWDVNRKGRGPILARVAEAHPCVAQSDGEAFAILRALQIARQRDFSRIQVRSDYNWLRHTVGEEHRRGIRTIGATFRNEVLNQAEAFHWVDFRYVPRRKNQIAHALARLGRTLEPGTQLSMP